MSACYRCKNPNTTGNVHLANGFSHEACSSCKGAFHDGLARGSLAEYHRVKGALAASGMSESQILSIIGNV